MCSSELFPAVDIIVILRAVRIRILHSDDLLSARPPSNRRCGSPVDATHALDYASPHATLANSECRRGEFIMSYRLETVAVILLTTLWAAEAPTQSHPQEVLDLISGHQALAAKVRPLLDRVEMPKASSDDSTGFRPEGAPIRGTVDAPNSGSRSDPEQRLPERLRHRDRAATSTAADRLAARLEALDAQAKAERERVMRPEFGVDLNRSNAGSRDVRFGDGIRGTRPPAQSATDTDASNSARVDARAIAQARSRLAALERELASIEAAIEASER